MTTESEPPVPDPIRHDDLTAYGTRLHAQKLCVTLGHVLHEEHAVPAVLAATLTFLSACEEAEVEPEAVLSQITQAREAGDLEIDDSDWEAIERRALTNH